MLRRLLACLALLTGLAAVGAPAHAGVIDAVGMTLELAQQAEDTGKTEEPACVTRQRQQRTRGEKVTPCKPSETVTVFIPTVQFGPDRALE